MGFRQLFQNTRYFFRWLGEILATWFLPYHINQEDEEEPVKEGETAAPTPKPGSQVTSQPATAAPAATAPDEPAPDESTATVSEMTRVLAFRGPVGRDALAAALNLSPDEIGPELESLADTQAVEQAGDGRYVLAAAGRRQILRADPAVSEWLSQLQSDQLRQNALDVLEEVCHRLPVKITAGRSLLFHIRQRKWMIWQSRPQLCRVRLFGSADRQHLEQLRAVDKRLRRFRLREPHHWDPRDWVLFRWQPDSDYLAIESILLEWGRQFQQSVRRRRRPARTDTAAEPVESPSDES